MAQLGRPFFDVNPRDASGNQVPPARDSARIVSAPTVSAGSVAVQVSSRVDSAGVRWRNNICGVDPGNCCSSRGDFLVGYQYLGLEEDLVIQDNISTPDTAPAENRASFDAFRTSNDFHAAEVGVLWQWQRCNWSLDLLEKLAIGNNRQRISISGATITTLPNIAPTRMSGGLLAQQSNIREYTTDDFTMVPELGATLGYQLTCNTRFTIGYTMIYWWRVSRPGDQIDTTVNPDFIPPPFAIFAGAAAPRFVASETDFWLQGLNVGVDTRW